MYSATVPNHRSTLQLLEIDANTTLTAASESQNVSTYRGQVIGRNQTKNGVDLPNLVASAPAPWPT